MCKKAPCHPQSRCQASHTRQVLSVSRWHHGVDTCSSHKTTINCDISCRYWPDRIHGDDASHDDSCVCCVLYNCGTCVFPAGGSSLVPCSYQYVYSCLQSVSRLMCDSHRMWCRANDICHLYGVTLCEPGSFSHPYLRSALQKSFVQLLESHTIERSVER